ncbi:MAG: N-acetylmuramoyl-L-alanine amidase [Thermoleophilia bacterium]|nr:N-acetylmuramoyl-L-alanine amidase [Thermoleophilia bacterium]
MKLFNAAARNVAKGLPDPMRVKNLDKVLMAGTGLGAFQSAQLYATGDNGTIAAKTFIGIGVTSAVGLALRQLPNPMLMQGGLRKALAGAAVLGTVGLTGVMASPAIADISEKDPYYGWGLAGEEDLIPGDYTPSTDRIKTGKMPEKGDVLVKGATPEEDVVFTDLTDKGAFSAERTLSFTDEDGTTRLWYDGKPNFIIMTSTGDGTKVEGDGPAADSFVEQFSKPDAGGSVHYVIDKAGNIANYVDPDKRAGHTTGKIDTGQLNRPGWNSAAIGIALVNDNSGTPYTEAQLESARKLVQGLSGKYEIPVGHLLMGRAVQDAKPSLVGFPWRVWADSLDEDTPLSKVVNFDGSVGVPNPLIQMDDPGPNLAGTNNGVEEARDAGRQAEGADGDKGTDKDKGADKDKGTENAGGNNKSEADKQAEAEKKAADEKAAADKKAADKKAADAKKAADEKAAADKAAANQQTEQEASTTPTRAPAEPQARDAVVVEEPVEAEIIVPDGTEADVVDGAETDASAKPVTGGGTPAVKAPRQPFENPGKWLKDAMDGTRETAPKKKTDLVTGFVDAFTGFFS